MTIAAKFYYGASLMQRSRVSLLSLERGKDWVADIVRGEPTHG